MLGGRKVEGSACLVLHVLEEAADWGSQYEVRLIRYCGRTKGSEMDDMSGLVLVIQCLRLRRVPMTEINSMNARYSFAYAPEISL